MELSDKHIEELLEQIRSLNANIMRLNEVLCQRSIIKAAKVKAQKTPLVPLTKDEIDALQKQFDQLYNRWLEGREIEVQRELEDLNVEVARRFADANNLNVTSKMSKDKIINLIGLRFREKKMLMSNLTSTKPLRDILAEEKSDLGSHN